MSEILGRDCDGRELRAGDRVEVVNAHPDHAWVIGLQGNAARLSDDGDGDIVTTIPSGLGGVIEAPPEWLRLINSGRDLFDQCAQRHFDKLKEVRDDILARRTARKPAEENILRSMPWTGADEQ